jgi:hypothetical protein
MKFAASLIVAGRAYAGIGSRETPADILPFMCSIACALEARGMKLRSGGADRADEAFGMGASIGSREIFTPWASYGPRRGAAPPPDAIPLAGSKHEAACMALAAEHHPTWHVPEGEPGYLTKGARLLHARNGQQALGRALDDPSAFVLCWTKGAAGGGGTGQAIRIARSRDIPVFDLADPKTLNDVLTVLGLQPTRPSQPSDAADVEI